jgi:hypothetical protein
MRDVNRDRKSTMSPNRSPIRWGGAKARTLAVGILSLVAVAAFAGAPTPGETVFGQNIGIEFVNAEQSLVERIPWGSDISNTIGKMLPFPNSLTSNGALPVEYHPTSGRVFPLTVVYIPEDEIPLLAISKAGSPIMESMISKDERGRRLIPFFIHPNELKHYRGLIEKYPQANVSLQATPSSSARSLLTQDLAGELPPFVVKTSLSVKMGGAGRLIDNERVARAVAVNDLVDEVRRESGGRLEEEGQSWDFFRESFAALPPDSKLGGYIFRELPSTMRDDIVLPVFALIADRSPKKRWIDDLYEKSGRRSMAEFIWEDLVKPQLDLHMVFMEHGLTTEFHQQNVCIRVDRATGKVMGVVLRDMDSNWVDHSLRAHALGLRRLGSGDFKDEAYLFRYAYAGRNHAVSYIQKLRSDNVTQTYRYVLDKEGMKSLLRKSDEYYMARFNRDFPAYRIERISQLKGAWERIARDVVTPDERKIYDEIEAPHSKKRFQGRMYDYYKEWLNLRLDYPDASFSAISRCMIELLRKKL